MDVSVAQSALLCVDALAGSLGMLMEWQDPLSALLEYFVELLSRLGKRIRHCDDDVKEGMYGLMGSLFYVVAPYVVL